MEVSFGFVSYSVFIVWLLDEMGEDMAGNIAVYRETC